MNSICYLLFFLILLSCGNSNTNTPLNLGKSNYLKLGEEITIPIYKTGNVFTENLNYNDSFYLSTNTFNNSLTVFKQDGKIVFFKKIDKKDNSVPTEVSGAWFNTLDSIFVYSEKEKQIYMFNKEGDLQKTIIKNLQVPDNQNHIPSLKISTKQIPNVVEENVYAVGYLGGETRNSKKENRPIIIKFSKSKTEYLGYYPNEYINKDWMGFHFREVFNSSLVKNKIYYNFPASSSIGVLNTENDSFYIKTIKPEIGGITHSNTNHPFDSTCKKPGVIPYFFYSQYSFGPIIYDKYRNLFYRFLLKPAAGKYLKKDYVGPQEKYLLIYDKDFNLLGFNDLTENYTHFNFFVNEKGLYIQKIYLKDENNMHFVLFSSFNYK